ncbi:MAG: hypothetical protein ABI352_02630 [Candidatus Dormibacter sp.]
MAALPCALYGGVSICSGEIASFDGAPLDVDVTKPATGGGTHPLILLFHGFGNNKHEWESTTDAGDNADKWHWNNHWFAKHGYYVVTYTARGFRDAGTTRPDEPNTPPGTTFASPPACATAGVAGSACLLSGTIRVKSKDVEIHDSQWLAALTAAAFPDIATNEVAVSGGSYGGGESWLQAAEPTWTFPNQTNPSLPVLQLQVAVPKYPWTDLAYSLAPNGHGGGPSLNDVYESAQGQQSSPTGSGNPFGVGKQSYVAALYAHGTTNGIFEEGTAPTPNVAQGNPEGPTPFAAWQARTSAGEPYDVGGAPGSPGVDDPVIAQIRTDFTQYNSAYYQPGFSAQVGQREVAVYSVSGWTDDLFPAIESFRMFTYLKRLDPLWPVSVGVADVGHSRAQNKPATWQRLNHQAWQTLQSNIHGSHRQQTTVFSEPTLCTASGDSSSADQLTATSPERLARGTLTVRYAQGGVLAPDSGAADPNGPATDAIVGPQITPGQGCQASVAASSAPYGGYTAYSTPLGTRRTFVGIGVVNIPYTLAGTDAILAARVWDVAPDGSQLQVSRGVYRLDLGYDAASGTVRLPLYGNDWIFQPGHAIRLDLQQSDSPTYRAGNPGATGAVTFGPPALSLPIRNATNDVIAGA